MNLKLLGCVKLLTPRQSQCRYCCHQSTQTTLENRRNSIRKQSQPRSYLCLLTQLLLCPVWDVRGKSIVTAMYFVSKSLRLRYASFPLGQNTPEKDLHTWKERETHEYKTIKKCLRRVFDNSPADHHFPSAIATCSLYEEDSHFHCTQIKFRHRRSLRLARKNQAMKSSVETTQTQLPADAKVVVCADPSNPSMHPSTHRNKNPVAPTPKATLPKDSYQPSHRPTTLAPTATTC